MDQDHDLHVVCEDCSTSTYKGKRKYMKTYHSNIKDHAYINGKIVGSMLSSFIIGLIIGILTGINCFKRK